MTLETVAVVVSIAYLILAVRQSIWCWPAALVSTTIYLYVFYGARLYMESALQIFYFAMALYGWYQWRRGDNGAPRQVSRWRVEQHVVAIAAILVLALGSGFLLGRYTDAALPFLDSLTTWGGIIATFMVARKVFENWHYWFVIDSVSIYLYVSRGLTQTAGLFVIYLLLIVVGYFAWRKDLHKSMTAAA